MNKPLSLNPALPRPPDPPKMAMSPELRAWLTSVSKWQADLVRAVSQDLQAVHTGVNTGTQGVGAVIASAPTIAVQSSMHHVTGTAAIATIHLPQSMVPPPAGTTSGTDFSGPVWLIADGLWTLVTGGNIAFAATPAVGQAVCIVFDPGTATWYPTAV